MFIVTMQLWASYLRHDFRAQAFALVVEGAFFPYIAKKHIL